MIEELLLLAGEGKQMKCSECGLELSEDEIEAGAALCWACQQWYETQVEEA